MPDKNNGDTTDAREIVTSQLVDAPRDLVFEAWSRAEYLERWWAPAGFTTTTHAFDFRAGGAWQRTVLGLDGTASSDRLLYDEIMRSERIVFSRHDGPGAPAPAQEIVTFHAHGEKTELTLRQVFATVAARDAAVHGHNTVDRNHQRLERLRETLATRPELRLARVFNAPRHLVFAAWSTAEHVSRWFTPAPLTTASCEVDLRTGGAFRIVMRMPSGLEHPMDARFVEVVPDERIVFTSIIHGGTAVWTDVRLREQAGQTTMTVHQVYSHESEPTRGAPMGWAATLSQLTEHVETMVGA